MGMCYSIFSTLIGGQGTNSWLVDVPNDDIDTICTHTAQVGNLDLNLPNRKIEELPQSISSCKSLTSLDLSSNRIRDWKYLSQLKQLKSLRARDNRLGDIPLEFYSCTKLTKLDVSDNSLKQFPRIGWSRLRKLDLSNNKIGTIHRKALSMGCDLRVLNMNCNQIRRLPCLENLRMLEELSVSNNKLGTLQFSRDIVEHKGEGFDTDTTIHSQSASAPSKKVDDDFKDATAAFSWSVMTKLKVLKAAHNKLRSVPDELGRVETLQFLFLNGNELTVVPSSLGNILGLVELRLQENNISSLPECLFRDHSLVSVLHLSSNRLQSLPRSIKYLTHLTELRVAHNELTSVPSEIGRLQKLRRLDVGYNRLRALPDSIGRLKRLRELCATNNDLHGLPTTLTNCTELRVLLVSKNAKMSGIVRDFASLVYLERLDASECAIERIDPSLGSLKHLQIVRLENNRLTSIPNEIAGIGVSTELQVFNMTGNPLIHVTPAILSMLRKSDRLSETSLPVAQSIVPGLLLGGMPAARNKAYLDALGVTHIINLAGSGGELNREGKSEIDANRIFPGQFRYLDVDVADSRSANLGPYFDTCVDFIDDAIDNGGVVLCHCWRGVSRSAAICIAYLITKQDLSYEGAFTEVKKRRSCVKCNSSFVEQLRMYEKARRGRGKSLTRNSDRNMRAAAMRTGSDDIKSSSSRDIPQSLITMDSPRGDGGLLSSLAHEPAGLS